MNAHKSLEDSALKGYIYQQHLFCPVRHMQWEFHLLAAEQSYIVRVKYANYKYMFFLSEFHRT